MLIIFRAEILLAEIRNFVPGRLAYPRQVFEPAFDCRCVAGVSLPMLEFPFVPRRNQYSASAILEKLPGGLFGRLDLLPELSFIFDLASPGVFVPCFPCCACWIAFTAVG